VTRLLLFILLAAGPAQGPAGSNAPAADSAPGLLQTVVRETASLQAELDLARGKGFYLRLDARRGQLALVLEGVAVEEHALDSLETAIPQVLFWRRPPPPDWDLKAYTGGRLEPDRERDRVEIVAPAPSPTSDDAAQEPSPPPIPPTAEESYSVPSRYRILFTEGPTLEVTAVDGGRNRGLLQRAGDALMLRAADIISAFRAQGAGRVRLRLRMSAEDAATLYRSLPPDVGLLVVGLAPRLPSRNSGGSGENQ
jgi:hypothetical protein